MTGALNPRMLESLTLDYRGVGDINGFGGLKTVYLPFIIIYFSINCERWGRLQGRSISGLMCKWNYEKANHLIKYM